MPSPSVFEAVEQILRSLVHSLPEAAAELQIDRAVETTTRRVIFQLIPCKPSAANVHVDVEEHSDVVAVCLGRGAVFEVPREGHRYTDLDCLDEVRALCLAAIRGELRETVLFKGDNVVGADAKIRVGSIETGDSWRQPTNPLRRRIKRSYEYEPYA